ncbi:cellulase family glycosylhydrolase [Kineosporia rhizophila]|uniref:cellulase family glycosylhydrolase n=1 Tax=Kineosporia rhizophila TaxID=84633 RepID=UPI001E5DD7C0|nr:cellulase family glycosylhydrolase [Kineosporia rhizophila]MCE0537571.1 cellulase family glycosylhydrolase [Kineosporia rhizophila]
MLTQIARTSKTTRSWIVLTAVALAAVLAFLVESMPTAQAATPPGLHVSGSKIVEKNGTPFVARGVSHPHAWYPSQTAATIPAVRAAGANALRVVLSSGARWTRTSAGEITSIISQCKENQLICMLEVHDTTGYGEEAAASSLDAAADYWVSVKSALVGQEDYVQLNIGNEPFGNGSNVSNWTSETSAAIQKLRSNGLRNQIIVDAPNWGQDWSFTMRNNAATVFAADPDANTVFSVHMYGVFDTASEVKDYLAAFTSKNLPIIVGEFGNLHSDGDPDEDTIMAEATRLGLGYYGWSWSGNGGGVEYLDMVTDFGPTAFTPWGTRIFNGADGIKSTAKTATIYGGPAPTPTVTPTSTTEPTATPPTDACTAVYSTGSSWGGGFTGSVKVTAGSSALRTWSVTLSLPSGTSIATAWNGTLSGGNKIANASWNGSLAAGASTEFGFQGAGPASGVSVASCSAS